MFRTYCYFYCMTRESFEYFQVQKEIKPRHYDALYKKMTRANKPGNNSIVVIPNELIKQNYSGNWSNNELARSVTNFPKASKLILPGPVQCDEFTRVFERVIYFTQYCGAMAGAGGRKMKCWAGILFISLLVIVVCSLLALLKDLTGLDKKSQGGDIAARLAGFIFYTNALLSLLFTWKLGGLWRRKLRSKWCSTSRKISSVETIISRSSYREVSLRKQLITFISIVVVGSTVEHSMSLFSNVGLHCSSDQILRCYILGSHGFLLKADEYTSIIGIIILAMSNLATVLWNVQDLLIIGISMGLTHNYKIINSCISIITPILNKVEYDVEKESVKLWKTAREIIARQAMLVREADDATGPLTLLSFLNNIYFICLQLFNGIGSIKSPLDQCYYLISLTWLCLRAAGVVLAASAVNYNSNKSIEYTFSCPSHHFNIEVHRLQCQLSKDHLALSGMQFFMITREFLLKVVGAITTYEIFIIQSKDN